VVADQCVHTATLRPRLCLQVHEKIHNLPGIGSPIQNVTGLHEVRRPADPVTFVVDDPGSPEGLDELSVVAMHVADRDSPRDSVPHTILIANRTARCQRERCQQERPPVSS
jgi:hypothetical protein